jgi:uncharacterized protein
MNDEATRPEQVMAALFQELSRPQQMALMARLELTGGSLYRAWAGAEQNTKAREALIAAAEREEANASLLRLMTEPKGECEKCHKALASSEPAVSCAFQCTFCSECGAGYEHVCPNCGGQLSARAA